ELRPLVRSQLDALAGSNMSWQGLAWPGVAMKLEMWRPDETPEDSASGTTQSEQSWTTRISLQLPELGEVSALLVLHADRSLSVRMAGSAAARAEFAAGAPQLALALSDAALPLAHFEIQAQAAE
ncbi:MAG: flagellar hook-length control protein FliK, partial [Rhodocyclaceae bacterium]|nr:flagellar hook-length control protein FliK [Rhodocyclaceae bacterium]